MVEVAEIIERIESVISMALRLKDKRILIFPLTMFLDEFEFIENVTVEWPLIVTAFGVVPVLILTLVTIFKSRRGKTGKSQ